MNEAKMTELSQAEEMAYFRADLCLYSPESYTLEESATRSGSNPASLPASETSAMT